jgi:hypothetical protein
MMSGEIADNFEATEISFKKRDVLMSPQDVIIECRGEKIRTHSAVLRRCKYFATLLDDADLDADDGIKIIKLPVTFDHGPSEVREFVMVLSNTINEADVVLLKHQLTDENVLFLAELAHYFDAPILQAACNEALTGEIGRDLASHEDLFWLLLFAIKNHLPRMRAGLIAELADNIDGTELLEHFDQGRGALCKDPVFVTELVTILNEKSNKVFEGMKAANKNLNTRAPAAIYDALMAKKLCPLHTNDAVLVQAHRNMILQVIESVLKDF